MTAIQSALESATFDTFVAYNTADRADVIRVVRRLRKLGVSPWVDVEQVAPGRITHEEIQRGIRTSRSAIVFIGTAGLGRYQTLELQALIATFVNTNIPIIPALLPGAGLPDDLPFLAQFQWIRFENGLEDEVSIELLVRGIKGRPLAEEARGDGRNQLLPLVLELEELVLEDARLRSTEGTRRNRRSHINALATRIRDRAAVSAGSTVAGARLIEIIGGGSFGTIWLAKHRSEGDVAVKVFHLDKLGDDVKLWRFRRSIQALKKLRAARHTDSIVRFIEDSPDGLAFSMEYIRGDNLVNIARRHWSLVKKLEVFRRICEAVSSAHEQDIIHRDIKPENIVLTEDDQPILTDFDVADVRFLTTVSVANANIGTAGFAAPEQTRTDSSRRPDERSDIFSLGRMFQHMLAEKSPGLPLDREADLSELRAGGVPISLIRIVRRATAWKPESRYPSVRALIRAVSDYDVPFTRAMAFVENAGRLLKRWAAPAILLVALMLGGAIFVIHDRAAQRRQDSVTKAASDTMAKLAEEHKNNEQLRDTINQLLVALDEAREETKTLKANKASPDAIERNLEKQVQIAKKLRDVRRQASKTGLVDGTNQGSNDLNAFDAPIVLGNATSDGDREALDDGIIQEVVESKLKSLGKCAVDYHHDHPSLTKVKIDFVIRHTGRISAIKVNNAAQGPLFDCLLPEMKALQFPTFAASQQVAYYWFTVAD